MSKRPHYSDLPVNVCPELCLICGSDATGYHYEVPSCNGCKTFFRRSVLDQNKYDCLKNKDCAKFFTSLDRRKCRACRMDRCLKMGMNPLSITTEGSQKKKEESNQQLMMMMPGPSTSPMVIESTISKLIDGLQYLETALDRMRKSPYSANHDNDYCLDSIITERAILGIHYKEDARFSPPSQDLQLFQSTIEPWQVRNVVSAIEYLKTFEFYPSLCYTDKRLIVRHIALPCTMLVMAYLTYSKEDDFKLFSRGLTHGDSSGGERDGQGKMISAMVDLVPDKNEYVLLKAIIACNPGINGLTPAGRHLLMIYQERYAKSLFSYTLARRGVKAGPSTYAAFMAIVGILTQVVRQQKDMFIVARTVGTWQNQYKLIDDIHGCCCSS